MTAHVPKPTPLSDAERTFAHLVAELVQIMLRVDDREADMSMGRINGLHVATNIGRDGYPDSHDPLELAIFTYILTLKETLFEETSAEPYPTQAAITATEKRLEEQARSAPQTGASPTGWKD